MKKILLVLLLIFLPAQAQAENGMYVKGNVGYFMAEDLDFDIAGTSIEEVDTENGLLVIGAIGKSISKNIDIEAEFSYRNASMGHADFADNGLIDVKTLMLNGIYHFGSGQTKPYLGTGIGVGWVDLGELSDTAVAYQFLAGVERDVSKKISILLGYRFLGTSDIEDNTRVTQGLDISTNLDSHNVELGVKYSF